MSPCQCGECEVEFRGAVQDEPESPEDRARALARLRTEPLIPNIRIRDAHGTLRTGRIAEGEDPEAYRRTVDVAEEAD